jgi:zinc transporter 1/2/3
VLFAEKLVLRWNKQRIRRKRRKTCQKNLQKVHRKSLVENSESAEKTAVRIVDRPRCARPAAMGLCPECIRGEPCSGFDADEINSGGQYSHTAISGVANNSSSAHLLSSQQPVIDIEDLASCATTLTGSGKNCPMSGTGECCSDVLVAGTAADWSQKEKHIIITLKVDDCSSKAAATKPVENGNNDDDDNGDEDDDEVLDDAAAGGHHHATRSIILILALSLHRIFEGMSIGLQHTVTNVASLFGAVMCHETVIGFSLGLQFVKSGFALRRLLITSVVCSSIMPVGVLVGLVMTELGTGGSGVEIANGLLQAVAMGTFIYVTFFEILQEEVDPDDTSLAKIAFIAVGFTLMALLDLIPEEQIEQLPTTLHTNLTLTSTVSY